MKLMSTMGGSKGLIKGKGVEPAITSAKNVESMPNKIQKNNFSLKEGGFFPEDDTFASLSFASTIPLSCLFASHIKVALVLCFCIGDSYLKTFFLR